mmetsp:Transcript_124476/g.346504  ORF Transcript_124476/g.346504 Transcript_124476/m.346504 type:complete len:367 (+) Transcript_124476:1838-2938(+)
MRCKCLGEGECLIPLQEVTMHIKRSIRAATLQKVLPGLVEPSKQPSNMTAEKLLVLNRLYALKVHHHAGCRSLSVGLLCPCDIQALEAPAAHCDPEVLGVQRQADLEGELEAVETKRLSEADVLPFHTLRELRAAAAQELVRAQTLLREHAAGLLADHSAVNEQHAKLSVHQGRGRRLDAQLALGAQLDVAQATHATAANLHLRVDVGVEVLWVGGYKNAGVNGVPENAVRRQREVVDTNAIVINWVVQPGGPRSVNEHHSCAFLVGEALLDSILVLVLIHVRAVNERVVLQAAVGVGIDQEVPHDGRASDGAVVVLPREDSGLPISAVALDRVQVDAALNKDARVRGIEAHTLHAPDILLLVHAR